MQLLEAKSSLIRESCSTWCLLFFLCLGNLLQPVLWQGECQQRGTEVRKALVSLAAWIQLLQKVTEPQNGWGWQGPLGPPSPIPAQAEKSRAGWPGRFCRCQRSLHRLSGHPVSMLCYLYIKDSFCCSNVPPVLQIVPIASCPGTGPTVNNLVLFSSHPLFRYLWILMGSSWASSSPDWTGPAHPLLTGELLQALQQLVGKRLVEGHHIQVSLVLGNPELDKVLQYHLINLLFEMIISWLSSKYWCCSCLNVALKFRQISRNFYRWRPPISTRNIESFSLQINILKKSNAWKFILICPS